MSEKELNATALTTCPVCNAECRIQRDITAGILCEESIDCPAGHWSYQYAYGSYCAKVGEKQWIWDYIAPESEFEKNLGEIKAALERMKRPVSKSEAERARWWSSGWWRKEDRYPGSFLTGRASAPERVQRRRRQANKRITSVTNSQATQ